MSKSKKRLRMAGNPEQLTNRQHIFPVASINRFVDSNGLVSVVHCATKKQFKVEPDDDIFCAVCVWDYRAESGYMRDVEKLFQALADEIVANKVVSLDKAQSEMISRFWALWSLRSELRDAPELDRPMNGIRGEPLANEQRDRLESLGGAFVLGSGDKLPSRFVTSLLIQKGVDEQACELKGGRWGIVRAQTGEFLVPDSPTSLRYVPLIPEMALCFARDNCVIPESEVATANLHLRTLAKRYYFARDLSACPGTSG